MRKLKNYVIKIYNNYKRKKLKKIIDSIISKKELGLEIGPSINPLTPKRAGFNVEILDHESTENLKKKYKDHNVNLNNIEEVDYIWKGESFKDLVREKKYDWILASHVIEHTPDLIGFLKNCEEILNETGKILLVIPDKRYCFDYFRENSSLGQILDSHFSENTRCTKGSLIEYFAQVVSNRNKISWRLNIRNKFNFIHTENELVDVLKSYDKGNYLDIHNWVFTPASFRVILFQLRELGYIGVSEDFYYYIQNGEFFIVLSKSNKKKLNKIDIYKLLIKDRLTV